MKNSSLFKGGLAATVVLAMCCFTPILVWFFAVLGLSALTGYLDLVLLPALVFFIGVTVYAFLRDRKSA